MLSREMQVAVTKLRSGELTAILRVQSAVLQEVQAYMSEKGVLQLLPVMVSPFTDPLNHSTMDGGISYYDERLQLTKSMILHKQLSLIGERDSIYIVSPNVRLETMEKAATGRHLIEFSQVDFELRGKSAKEVMLFTEELLARVFSKVKAECKEEMELLGRVLKIPRAPFEIFDSHSLEKEFGPDWEKILSERSSGPVWVTNHEREFYDKEDPEKPFSYLNYDLIYPEGYGEGLSGGEREHEYGKIRERMRRNKMDMAPFEHYLEVAKAGLLRPSAGAGFGVERLVRFITGRKHISEVSPFAKVPGEKFVF